MAEEWPGGRRFIELLAARTEDPAVMDATTEVARRSPLVTALPVEETRRHVRAMAQAAVAALVTGEVRDEDLHAAERLGEDRALQGIPLTALLDGFHAARTHLVRLVVDEGRVLGVPPDDLLEGITRVDAIATALAQRMVHAHRVAELEQSRTARETRVQTLRQLLHGEPVTSAIPLDPDRPYHCLVSDISDPATAQELESTLSAAAPGAYGLVDGRLAALVTRPPGRLDPPDAPWLFVASPAAPLGNISGLYGLCRRTLQAAEAYGLRGLRLLTDLAMVTAVAEQPELGRLLSQAWLGALRPEDAFHTELAETALAYLEHGGRIEPTAAALHVHPNTVKYRVRRLQELTGRPLTAPAGAAVTHAAHWWWALKNWTDDGGGRVR
ncbi:PucR family transcriptional regulator [Actinomadura alba]|uniref:PucR family transcriptional regulator n=1 Tax=Actinomadura alba TaxID=406431 RepID=UPI0031E0F1F8